MAQYFENDPMLKSEFKTLKYKYLEYEFNFTSDLGVFAKSKIDEGSKLLAETYFYYGKKEIEVLDVGCGYGFLGITLAKIMNCQVDMIDINNRALHLAEMNAKENSVTTNIFFSNMYENITKKYDLIITNPPIRASKCIYLEIINQSFKYLKNNGELWFVMRTNHGVKTVVKGLKIMHDVEILSKNKGFYVISAKKKLTS